MVFGFLKKKNKRKRKKIYEVDLKFYVLILILRVLWCDFGGFCERDLGLA